MVELRRGVQEELLLLGNSFSWRQAYYFPTTVLSSDYDKIKISLTLSYPP
jgi:hypothetical protein